jgi:hypothetical protein
MANPTESAEGAVERPDTIRWIRMPLVLPGDDGPSVVRVGRAGDGSTWVPVRWLGYGERFVAEAEGWSIAGPGGDYVRTVTVRRQLARTDFHRTFLDRVERTARAEARRRRQGRR